MKNRLSVLCAVSLITVLISCLLVSCSGPKPGDGDAVMVGTKNFTEQLILGEMMAQLIEAKTDLKVKRRSNLGGTMICHKALAAGEIDLYAEYTGTALTAILKRDVISDPDKAYELIAEEYRKEFDCEWLKPFGFNNTYAITVREDDSEERGWKSISDLRGAAGSLSAGFTAEFMERPDGYPGLKKKYGFKFGDDHDLDPGLMYKAMAQKEVDVICAFATDGRIAAYNLKPLNDDKGFFPPYFAAPVIRSEALKKHPKLVEVLNLLGGRIDDAAMQNMNYQVDEEKKEIKEVVKSFLEENIL